ncbi:MAG: phosphatase PAP2 family protein [Bacteroidia bacterium]|nr:phosphatase PAP2 family protein [Bacteroidia bacterium]
MNQFYTPWLDIIIPPFTHLADSIILVALVTILLIRRNAALLALALMSLSICGILVIGLKKYIFYDWHRPLEILGSTQAFHCLVPIRYHSFPSGHASTIMSVLPMIAFFYRYRALWVQVLVACIGIFIAYTRVYIGVHFLADILVGSVLSTVVATFILVFAYDAVQEKLLSIDFYAKQGLRRGIIWLGYILLFMGILRINGFLGVEPF